MALSQQQVQHLRSLNDAAATCALARIESLERAAADQELRERTQSINTEQRFHELQARVAAVSFEALQYKKQIEDLEVQVSSLVVKEKELLARHSDASISAAREMSKSKRLEQQVDELHRDKVQFVVAVCNILPLYLQLFELRANSLFQGGAYCCCTAAA
jgi:chromosome segregation ATPase